MTHRIGKLSHLSLLALLVSMLLLATPTGVSAKAQVSPRSNTTSATLFRLIYGHPSTHQYKPQPVHHPLKTYTHAFLKRGVRRPNDSNGNLDYSGGPVMRGTTSVYVVFWEPNGSYVSSNYHSLLERYFQDVGSSPLYANNQQYTDTSGNAPTSATLVNIATDSNPYPSQTLADSDIQGQVTAAQNALNWAPSSTTIFMIYLARGETLCNNGSCSPPAASGPAPFCAYHGSFGDPANPSIYGAMPYDGNDLSGCYELSTSPNGDTDADAEISTTSHEQIEAATNPLGNAWWDTTSGQEIGDKCAYVYGPTDNNGANVTWNNNSYIVQGEWDNAQTGCVLAGP